VTSCTHYDSILHLVGFFLEIGWSWQKLMEVISQGELHWSHEFLGVAVRCEESDWFRQITWRNERRDQRRLSYRG